VKCTYCHPDGETDEGENGQLENEVDVDHDSYGRHEGQSWSHEQQSLPGTDERTRRHEVLLDEAISHIVS
jgi:hypothetical protein